MAVPVEACMGLLLLTALAGLLGYGLGQGVPRLVQRSGALARRSQTNQLGLGLLLLTPWLVGGLGLLVAISQLSLGLLCPWPAMPPAWPWGAKRWDCRQAADSTIRLKMAGGRRCKFAEICTLGAESWRSN